MSDKPSATQHSLLDDAANMLEAHGFRAVADQIVECKKEIPNMPLSARSESTHWVGCGMEGGHRHYECLKREYAELSARSASGLIPEGWKLVPLKPTPKMIRAANISSKVGDQPAMAIHYPAAVGPEDVYEAMVRAADRKANK